MITSEEFLAVVRAKRLVADGVAVVELEPEEGERLPAWAPGAHLDLVLEPDLVRQYSLCGEPEGPLRIGVLREADGRGGSIHVHDRIAMGDKLTCRGPRNHFPLVEAPEYVFVAGGIGITPILPMIARCVAEGRAWRLVYGGRTRASMAFLDELAAYDDRVTLHPQDELGHIDLAAALGTPREGVAVYCCGPGPLLDAIEAYCADWPAGTLRVERFRAAERADEGVDTAFEVVCDYSDMVVGVAAGQTIVEALTVAGIDVPTSCGEGTCGTCETTVLEGTPDHRDSYLSPQERESNEVITPCCSRSCTPRLVLDL
jgi:ferredoxin-NADP reductase